MSVSTLLEEAQAQEHLVQFYEANEDMLVANVGRYLCEGLKRGQALLIVATRKHTEKFLGAFESAGCDVAVAMADGMLTCLGANETLARFMVDGHPDAGRFQDVVGTVVREASSRAPHGLRAYGEMVGELWKAGQYPAAIRLEQLWHKLLAEVKFSLYCAYPIDIFDQQFQPGVVDALLCAHTHLLPAGSQAHLEAALQRAMDEVLGNKVRELRAPQRSRYQTARAEIPAGEATILWLRNHAPARAQEILRRAKSYYQELTTRPADPAPRSFALSAT